MAKLKIRWSIEAKQDLFDILEYYILRNGNPIYSKKLNTILLKNIHNLSIHPYLGKLTEFPTVRILIKDDYEIIYEVLDELILMIMIFDCRQNPEKKQLGFRKKN
jgi:plasmid stabilization system protein ParE